MILHCNYEEIRALRAGARAYLDREVASSSGGVLAPPESRARVEALLPQLEGDFSFSTLAELWAVLGGVAAVVQLLRAEMETAVLATHPADEGAVSAYFDYAHGLAVEGRLREMTAEMAAMIELVTGEVPTPETARTFKFPD